MNRYIAHVSILVNDYDEAIKFYTEKLNFVLIEDSVLSETKRWVLVAPSSSSQCCLLLAKASNEEQSKFIGSQSGGRVFLFMHTDDFWRDYNTYRDRGVVFVREPVIEKYGTVAVFRDLYGNLWDLIERVKTVEKPNQP